MKKQLSMSFFEDEMAGAKTNKKEFLEQIDRLIPWGGWEKKIEPHYYKGERGNKPYELELMLRIYVLQNLYNLADMAAKNEVIDSRAFSQFCGVESSNQVPDGDTIGRFRNILTKNHLQEELFGDLVRKLKEQGLILTKGTIVDSTLIAASPSTKNRERERDPEAHQSKKGKNWHFGYKAHIGVDRDTGLIHHLETTAGNVSDVAETSRLMTGDEEELYGDSGYTGAAKRDEAITTNSHGKKIRYKINKRRSTLDKGPGWKHGQQKRREREKSSVRAKVEHVFAVVKRQFRYRKTRYRGLIKTAAAHYFKFTLANLILADRIRLAA